MAANGGGNFTARTRFRGSQTLLPAAMAALAIDTTKSLNTKTVAAASVFTFSGTPRAGERFSLALKNSTGSSVTITLPVCFSVNTQALVNRFTLAASGRELLSFQYDATDGYFWLFGEPAGATLVGIAPTLVSAEILTVSGAEVLDLTFTEAVAIGAGGLGVALTASGGAVTPTYASGTGTATLRCSLSRRVASSETITGAHTQAGNGIEASDDGTDVETFTGQAVTNSSAFAGGGAAWFDSFDPGTGTGETSVSYNGQIFGGVVTPSSSGVATQIRFHCSSIVGASGGKLALVRASDGVVLASGSYTSPGAAPAWVSVDISATSPSLTSGTDYVVFQCAASPFGEKATNKSGVTGKGRENYDQVYASFPASPVSRTTTAGPIAVGIYVG